MKKLACFFLLFAVFSCYNERGDNTKNGNRKINEKVKPFKATIFDIDYSLGGSNQYIITEKDITILHRPGFIGAKDTIIYYKVLYPTETLMRISETYLDSLKERYVNSMPKDGTQILVKFKKQDKEKTISISNFYHPTIGQLIGLVNNLIPHKLKISYRKESMVHPDLR